MGTSQPSANVKHNSPPSSNPLLPFGDEQPVSAHRNDHRVKKVMMTTMLPISPTRLALLADDVPVGVKGTRRQDHR